MGHGLLEGERAQHDARDHREVEVRVGVAGQAVPLPARARPARAVAPSRSRRCRSRSTTAPGEPDPERTDERHRRVQFELGADPERDHGLAQGEDDDQIVALGKVPGDEPPAVHAVFGREPASTRWR